LRTAPEPYTEAMANIALVVLDTVRKDTFDDVFDWLPGTHFEQAFSTSHRTVPAHASLFTGQYASEVGITAGHASLDTDSPVLAERLNDAGHRTRAFSANPYISGEFNFDRGFDEFTGSWRLQSFDSDLFDWGIFIANSAGEGPLRYFRALRECVTGDCDTVRSLKHGATLKLYDRGLGPFQMDDGARAALDYVRNTSFGADEFLFLNLMEAHAPYNPPSSYQHHSPTEFDAVRATLTDPPTVDVQELRGAYEDSVTYLAEVYADIFGELQTTFDYIITVADHGELFGEHGAWNHCYGVYPELTQVPLVIWEGRNDRSSDHTVTSLLDVYATVLDMADHDAEARGTTLLDDRNGGVYLTEYFGLTPRQRRRLGTEDVPKETIEAYNQPLAGIATPDDFYGFETQEGFTHHGTSVLSNPRAELDSRLDSLDRPDRGSDPTEVAESVLSQLEDLGYT